MGNTLSDSMKILKKIGKIESATKIVYSPKYNGEKNNYNTFCTFKSIDEIFYLVYVKEGNCIAFYNLIDERNAIEIETYDMDIIDIKYLFDENNKRDLLFSLSEYMHLKLWNVSNCECLFNIKIEIYYYKDELNHLGILKLNNNDYNIIVTTAFEALKIYDLNGNKLNENYRNNLNIENANKFIFIDTYYDKKLCNNYIFFYHNYDCTLFSVDYQKGILYQTYSKMSYYNTQIIINDDDENLKKVIFLIYCDSIGIFDFHSGKLLYKINLTIIPFENKTFKNEYHYDKIYSLNYWNSNYLILSYGKVVEADVSYHSYGARETYEKKYHSLEIINLKEKKMEQILKLKTIDKSIFSKKLFHPKYGDCLLTQDNSGEIKIIQIKLA